jgi:hypothetical protein
MRTEKDIRNEALGYLAFKLLVSVLSVAACAALWTLLQQWSLMSKLISHGGLLAILSVSLILGLLQSAATINSSTGKSVLVNLSGLANMTIAMVWLLVFVSAGLLIYSAAG